MGRLIKDEDLKNPEFTHGFLFWDVPTRNARMGNLIRTRVRPFAKAVNNSVRLFPWEHAAFVEGAVLEVREETGQTGTAYVLPLTASSEPYLIPMLEDAMTQELERLCRSLRERLEAVPRRIKEAIEAKKLNANDAQKSEYKRRKAIFRDVKKRVEELQGVALALRLQDKFEGWAKMAKQMLEVEQKAIEALARRIRGAAR